MDEFDDFDIGPQSDELIPEGMDTDDLSELEDDDGLSEEDELVMDDEDFRLLSSEWDEREDEEIDWDWDND